MSIPLISLAQASHVITPKGGAQGNAILPLPEGERTGSIR